MKGDVNKYIMSDSLNIIIKALLSETTSSDLQKQLEIIEKKLKPLNLKASINADGLQVFTKQIEETQKKVKEANKEPLKFGSLHEVSQQMSKTMTELERIRDIFKDLGKNVQVKQVFDSADGALKKFEVSVDTLRGKLKETQVFGVTAQYDQDGGTSYDFSKITMGSKEVAEAKQKETQAVVEKTVALKNEIIEAQHLINLYKAGHISASEFMNAGQTLIESGKLNSLDNDILKQRSSLLSAMEGAEKKYTSAIKEEISVTQKLVTEKSKLLEKERNTSHDYWQGRFKESVSNLTSSPNDELKQLNEYYSNLQKESSNLSEIDHQIAKINNSLERLKVGKNKVFADSRVVTEVNKLKDMEGALKRGEITSKDFALQMQKVRTSVAQVSNEFRNVNRDGYSFAEMIGVATKKIAIWGIGTTLIYDTLRIIKSGISYVVELDNAMNQLRIVMNLSNEKAIELGRSYNALAKEMSVTTTEIAQAAVEFARQGLSLEQMDDRLRNTIKYAKISGMEFEEAAEIITASVNSMGVETQRAIDIFSYMGDATATGKYMCPAA